MEEEPGKVARGAAVLFAVFIASGLLMALFGAYFFLGAFALFALVGLWKGRRVSFEHGALMLFVFLVLAQLPIAIVDWHVLSLAKAAPNFQDADLQPYWHAFFGLLLPFLWLCISFALFLGSGRLREPAAFFVAALIVQNSGLEDFLFFIYGNYVQHLSLFSFPASWPWLALQSSFVGHAVTSLELGAWCVMMLDMALLLASARFSPRQASYR
jgi:hypothetical protein